MDEESAIDRVVRCATFVQETQGGARLLLRMDGEVLGGAAIRVVADADGTVAVHVPTAAARTTDDRLLLDALAKRLRGAGVRLIEVEDDA